MGQTSASILIESVVKAKPTDPPAVRITFNGTGPAEFSQESLNQALLQAAQVRLDISFSATVNAIEPPAAT